MGSRAERSEADGYNQKVIHEEQDDNIDTNGDLDYADISEEAQSAFVLQESMHTLTKPDSGERVA